MTGPAQYFRSGTGAVIFNKDALILALERADHPGSWQLPQGGMEAGEEPHQAVIREVSEEAGIDGNQLDLTDAYPEPLVYELPPDQRSEKTGRGQVQYWFLFKFLGGDQDIRLANSDEFIDWRWMPFQVLIEAVVDFRKPLYRKLAQRFEPRIRRETQL